MFGPGREQAIGFLDAFGHQVVDEDPDIRLVPSQNEGRLLHQGQGGVYPGHEPLGGRLFVAGGAVYLPGQVEAADPPALQGMGQLGRGNGVVFYAVGRSQDLRPVEAGYGSEDPFLDLERQARGDPVDVDLGGLEPLGLEKELMAGAVREFDDLVFDGRTIPGPDAGDPASVKRGLVDVLQDHGVGRCVGVSEMAEDLVLQPALGPIGERHRLLVARLGGETLPFDGVPVQTHGRSGLEPEDLESQGSQLLRQMDRRRLVGPAGRIALEPDMDDAVQKGPGGQNDRVSLDAGPLQGPDAPGPAFLDQDLRGDALEYRQPGDPLQVVLHGRSVGRLVALGPGRLNGPAPAPVEEPELDARSVGQQAHQPSQSVYLAHQMALGQPSDGRIAGHLGDRLQVDRDQAGLEPHAADGGGGLASGVPRPDHDDVVPAVLAHVARRPRYFPTQNRPKISSRTSSARTSPVRRPTSSRALRTSSAQISSE